MQPTEWQGPVEAFPMGFNQGDGYFMQNQDHTYYPQEGREQDENGEQDMRIFPFYRPFFYPPFYGGFYPYGGYGWGGYGGYPYYRPYYHHHWW